MAKRKQPFNPFYALLVIVGVGFTITACAYALMMLRATRPTRSESGVSAPLLDENNTLMTLLDERGMEILGGEVLLLGVAMVGAIGLDQYRGRRDSPAPQSGEVLRCDAERGNEEGQL